jgi:polyferredoxin
VAKTEEPQGDCINCYRCVQVCPTGIDIRRGVQLECVACTACIDACDEVMLNIHKAPNLIGYSTLAQQEGKKPQHFRPRVVILSLALLGVLSGLVWVLTQRAPVKTTIFNAKTVAYQVLTPNAADPQLTNPFMLAASNYTFDSAQVQLVVTGADQGKLEIIAPQVGVPIAGGQEVKTPFFLKFPKSLLKDGKYVTQLEVRTRASNGSWQRAAMQEVHLVGPY